MRRRRNDHGGFAGNSAEYKRQRAIWGGRVASSEAGKSLSAPLTGTIDKALAKCSRAWS